MNQPAIQEVLRRFVFDKPDLLYVCKLSGVSTRSSFQELITGFIQSSVTKVCLILGNMQEVSKKIINHVRIMIEESEILYPESQKVFIVLLHFPPDQLFSACYPSLFLQGWDHVYLDTIACSREDGIVDISDWFWQCCCLQEPLKQDDKDSLLLSLKGMLPQAIPVISSRLIFGARQNLSLIHI